MMMLQQGDIVLDLVLVFVFVRVPARAYPARSTPPTALPTFLLAALLRSSLPPSIPHPAYLIPSSTYKVAKASHRYDVVCRYPVRNAHHAR